MADTEKKSPLAVNLAFALVAAVIIFLLFESGLRFYVGIKDRRSLTGEKSTAPVTVEMEEYPEYGIVFHSPNQKFVDTNVPSRKYHVTINGYGFRGGGIEKQKRPGTVRIMILGDSFTYGDGVDDGYTLSQQLQDILNKGLKEKKYEVINAGRLGSYLTSEIELYEKYGRFFNPDVLILAYCYNDISEMVYTDLYKRNVYNPKPEGENRVGLKKFISSGAEKSVIYKMVLKQKAETIAEREFKFVRDKKGRVIIGIPIEPFEKGENKDIEWAVSAYERRLLGFRDELKSDGVRLIFIIYPTPIKDEEIKRPVNRELFEFAEDNGIPAIDLRGPWLAVDSDIKSFFDVDTHPTARAYSITASEIEKKLRSEKIISQK